MERWHIKQRDGQRVEVDPADLYLQVPVFDIREFRAALERVRGERELKSTVLKATARAGLKKLMEDYDRGTESSEG